ncbi:cell division protein FtsA, partial [Aminipila sp.]|uniref:cell division protein FtsA n=1 Tax=Aminipila sp. TaxID=2060095 RepID=UPI00289996E8
MDDKKIVFALDIGTRSVVGIVGALKDGNFNILDYEQEFHEKRAMRDGQIEDIDLVSRVANSVKRKLEQRTGQTFTKVSIAAAGRALRTAAASFSYDLIPNQPISSKIIQYMEYSAIEKAQEIFLSDSSEQESSLKDYYCVGYSVTDYLLDDYKIKNLEGQKGKKAVVDIIAAFLPASVLISLYAVTARCSLEVDNLTLEPIAAIHAVVPDDVRFLNIALVDIGGGTSDIAISRDGSVIAYDMVTIAGDEITEALMQHYLTNFATAERIKLMLSGDAPMEFKDILGNEISLTPDEAYEAVREPIHALAEAISQRILLINGSAPAAVFLVGGGSQIKGLCKIVADKLGMAANRVAVGVVNTENNLSLFSDSLYSPTFVTPIGIGIVSSLYRGCDFFAISVNGKRIMLFNHQTIKVLDAL